MTIPPREPSEQDQSDAEFLARLGRIIVQAEAEGRPQPVDIIDTLRGMAGQRCGICGGLLVALEGHGGGELVHVDPEDRAQSHRAVLRPGQFDH